MKSWILEDAYTRRFLLGIQIGGFYNLYPINELNLESRSNVKICAIPFRQLHRKSFQLPFSRLITNSLIVGCFLAFVRWRFVTTVHLNIGVMRNASFFPVISYFLADKGIRKFAPDIAPGAGLAPSRQYFFHFHLRLLSAGTLVCRIKKFKRVYFLPATVAYVYHKLKVCAIS